MAVHLSISNQINAHLQAQQEYKKYDQMREQAIEKVLQQAKEGNEFSVAEINQWTDAINSIALKYYFPTRKTVTPDMILSFLNNK